MDFHDQYKPIRNKIRKLNKRSLVELCVKELNKFKELKSGGIQPWIALFILKVALAEGNNNQYASKPATPQNFIDLHNKIHSLIGVPRFLNDKSIKGLNKFLRIISFQQFWVQSSPNLFPDLARQHLIYQFSRPTYRYTDIFEKHVGVGITQFLDMMTFTYSYFFNNESFNIRSEYFAPLRVSFSENVVDNFLQHISLTVDEASEFCKKELSKYNVEYQLHEISPLVKYPLLRDGNNYYSYGNFLFAHSTRFFIYDFLKEKEGSAFTEKFGPSVEKYIKIGLEHLKVDYLSESEIRDQYTPNSPSVDFCVYSNECSILIESKAIEMKSLTRIDPTNKNLTNEFKSSLLKAIKQAFSVVGAMQEQRSRNKAPQEHSYYLLVVTYKSMYLGRTIDVWEEFIEEGLLAKGEITTEISRALPPKNIFFMSIEEYDFLISAVSNNNLQISEVLKKMAEDSTSPEKATFDVGLHLSRIDNSHINLPYLEEETNRLLTTYSK